MRNHYVWDWAEWNWSIRLSAWSICFWFSAWFSWKSADCHFSLINPMVALSTMWIPHRIRTTYCRPYNCAVQRVSRTAFNVHWHLMNHCTDTVTFVVYLMLINWKIALPVGFTLWIPCSGLVAVLWNGSFQMEASRLEVPIEYIVISPYLSFVKQPLMSAHTWRFHFDLFHLIRLISFVLFDVLEGPFLVFQGKFSVLSSNQSLASPPWTALKVRTPKVWAAHGFQL